MEEDQTHCNSPVISQYGAQHYRQPNQTVPPPDNTEPTEHTSLEHTSLEPTSSVHKSPVHKSPDHTSLEPSYAPMVNRTALGDKSPEHRSILSLGAERTTPVRVSPLQPSPSGTPPWLYTPESPPLIYKSTIYNAADHPNSPAFHHLLNQGLEIFEPISPETSQPNVVEGPVYDTSMKRDSQRPLQPITPETSPTKSPGFADHARTVNVFAATATSRRTSIPILNFDQSQVTIDQAPFFL